MTVAWLTLVIVFGMPLVALADWAQFQGGPTHAGVSDGPSAPLEVAWRHEDITIDDADVTGGLSSPVVAEDGTIVVVGPNEVLAFDGEDRSEVFSAERDLGPSVQAAIGEGADGPIVVFAEGFARAWSVEHGVTVGLPVGLPSATPSSSPAEEGDEVDSHLAAVDLRTGESVWPSAVPLEDAVRTPVAVDETAAYVGDISGRRHGGRAVVRRGPLVGGSGHLDRGGRDRRRRPGSGGDRRRAADARRRGGARPHHRARSCGAPEKT